MQVSLLRLNSGISRAVQTQTTLEKQNMALQSSIAELTSGERVTTAAAGGQMIEPPAGQTRYLTARPASDPARAARRYKPPSERAKAIMANNGMLPGALAPPARRPRSSRRSLGARHRRDARTTTPPRRRPTPRGHDVAGRAGRDRRPPRPSRRRSPTPVVTAVPTTPPPVTTDPATGAATAPQG